MGCHENITAHTFPLQGTAKGKAVDVMFHRDGRHTIEGVCVRDDAEQPFLTIIRLDDGRYVLGTECQYRILHDS